jgi:hypothetical protein
MHKLRKHEVHYRGYRIEMERRDLCWKVRLERSHSGVPVLPHSSFATITQSKREAMRIAKRRVDWALARTNSGPAPVRCGAP